MKHPSKGPMQSVVRCLCYAIRDDTEPRGSRAARCPIVSKSPGWSRYRRALTRAPAICVLGVQHTVGPMPKERMHKDELTPSVSPRAGRPRRGCPAAPRRRQCVVVKFHTAFRRNFADSGRHCSCATAKKSLRQQLDHRALTVG